MTHPTDATNPSLENANTQREYEVRRQDLPLSCPTPEQKLWNSHPRVYLPIEDDRPGCLPVLQRQLSPGRLSLLRIPG